MRGIVALREPQRSELFSEAARMKGTTPAVIEKDFWVTWVLGQLFAEADLASQLRFKGGTSLSKVYGLIERFSEDIDLVLDWSVLQVERPLAKRSRTKQAQLNQELESEGQRYIADSLLPRIASQLGPTCTCRIAAENPNVIHVGYPGAFSDGYLRPGVRLEIGPLASWLPHEERTISSYAAESFPELFESPTCRVSVIKAERTFWEKATILHHEAHRPEGSPQPPRYSRHYYDLFRMARSPIKSSALSDLELLADVVKYKQTLYPRGWARYELAKPGTLRLVPDDRVRLVVEADYRNMANMIFGERPSFESLMADLQRLEHEIRVLGDLS